MSGYVYVVKNGNNKYKIGHTRSSIEKRIAALQTASHTSINIIIYFKKDEPDAFEKELHWMFSDKKIRGEWFDLDHHDIKQISNMDGAKEYIEGLNSKSKIASPYGERWMQMNQEFLDEFSERKDIGADALRVFLKLNARLDFENVILVPQVEIAQSLGMHKQSVHRAIKKLESLGIILRGPKVGRSSSWRLNPNAGWKGKTTHLRAAQRDHLRLIKNQNTRSTEHE